MITRWDASRKKTGFQRAEIARQSGTYRTTQLIPILQTLYSLVIGKNEGNN